MGLRASAEARMNSAAELIRQKLRDLGGIQGRALAQVVSGDEEVQRARVVDRAPDTTDPAGIGTHRVNRHRELAGRRVVDDYDAGRAGEDLSRRRRVDLGS